MRTLIQGGWVVGYDGRGHELIPNGSVVFEGDRVVHVGGRFDGAVDRTVDARGKLVSPGFVNCHLHAAVNAGSRPHVGRAPAFCATGAMPKMSLPPTVIDRAIPDAANASPLKLKPAGSRVTQLNVNRWR